MKVYKGVFKILMVFLFVGVLVGCQTTFFSSKGKEIPSDRLITLKRGGPYEGKWGTNYYFVNYRYKIDQGELPAPGILKISGQVNHTVPAENCRIWLNFLDGTGKIVDKKLLYSGIYKSFAPPSFDHELKIPLDSSAVTFTNDFTELRGGSAK
jgi:hypothetical protein